LFIWLDGIIASVNSSAWELHTRGLPLPICRHISAVILNRCVRTRSDDGWIRLEWWQYRSMGGYSPLWDCVTEEAPAVPTGDEVVRGPAQAPGCEAWKRKNKKRFGSAVNETKLDRYMVDFKQTVYGSLFPRKRNAFMHSAAAGMWPPRNYAWPPKAEISRPHSYAMVPQGNVAMLAKLQFGGRYPSSVTELLGRFGLDAGMLELLGGWKELLNYLRPWEMQHFTAVVAACDPPKWLHYEDSAIKAHVTNAFPQFVADEIQVEYAKPNKQVALIVAGNAAGKTTYMMGSLSGSCLDWDDVLRLIGALKDIKANAKTVSGPRLQEHHARAAAAMLNQSACEVILTQYPPKLVMPVLAKLGWSVRAASYVVVDPVTMWVRTAEARVWSLEKVERRATRIEQAIALWKQELCPLDVVGPYETVAGAAGDMGLQTRHKSSQMKTLHKIRIEKERMDSPC
jgi:hypothetical protein